MANRTVRFGDFDVDLRAGELLKRGHRVKLQEKPFQILEILLEQPGEMVGRQELAERLWPADTFVDFERGLNTAIGKLRTALGDSAEKPRYIETVARRGYRFIGNVQRADGSTPRPFPKSSTIALLASAIVLSLAGYLWLREQRAILPFDEFDRGRDISAAVPQSIAVLPFKSISPDDEDIYLELGLADALITKLSNVSRITVRPTSAVRDYTETRGSSIEVARELHVDAVLEGTVQRNEDTIRVTVQLLRVDYGTPMWADTFDEDFTDIFVVQDTIAERVASALVSTLTREDRAALTKSYTDNIEALQLYWRGRFFVAQRDEKSLWKSIELFKGAARIDPSYAPAYAGIAHAYAFITFNGYARPADVLIDLKAAVTKALELDDRLAEAQTVLGALKVIELDWEGSERARKRAIELDPNDGTAHLTYAWFLSGMERHEESLEHRKSALMNDPNNPVMRAGMARGYLGVGQLDRAEKQARQTIELYPDHPFAYWHLGDLYLVRGRLDEAIKAFEGSGMSWRLGYAYGVAGRREEALAILKGLEEKSERGDYVSPLHRAAIYAGLGDKDKAFYWLEQAYREKTPFLTWYRVDHTLDPLRSDPRYVDLGRRLGLLE